MTQNKNSPASVHDGEQPGLYPLFFHPYLTPLLFPLQFQFHWILVSIKFITHFLINKRSIALSVKQRIDKFLSTWIFFR